MKKGLTALLAASIIGCGGSRDTFSMRPNDLLVFQSEDYYDPSTGSYPFIVYYGPRTSFDSLHDDLFIIGHGYFDSRTEKLYVLNQAWHRAEPGASIVEDGILYIFEDIANDNDGISDNNVLRITIDY